MKILRLAGPSNSGKTTLLLAVLAELKRKGLRVATIKNSHHELNLSDKDSSLLAKEGADYSLAIGKDCCQLILQKSNRNPKEWIHWLFPDVDVVLIEGWRNHTFPTILVTAQKPSKEWQLPEDIIGYFGWTPNEKKAFQNAKEICQWLLYP